MMRFKFKYFFLLVTYSNVAK